MKRITVSLLGVGVILAAGAWFYLTTTWASAGHSRPAAPAMRPAAASGSAAAAHQPTEPPDPAKTVQLEDLRRRLAAAPDDLRLRKQLAVNLLDAGQPVEAFEEAGAVLLASPEDVDGLYVQGEVRLQMGQPKVALELFDRVLLQVPDHVLALLARGRAATQLGVPAQAVDSYQRALAATGGSHPQIERLLAEARAAAGTQQ
ncbi:MAG TPA: tetratricopeptide repeat protein [Thermoanaerobaculia bacterium]|nr:tetratricopeptide repeat protein [Thermoanaerobaculia bacterium]